MAIVCAAERAVVDRLEVQLQRIDDQIAETEAVCQGVTDPREAIECRRELQDLRQARSQTARQLETARAALRDCEAGEAGLPSPGIINLRGRLTFLRVHEGGGFGPQSDFIDGEVIFGIDSVSRSRAFGFKLLPNDQEPAHEGMLSLLREAFVNNLEVSFDYDQRAGHFNNFAFRIALVR